MKLRTLGALAWRESRFARRRLLLFLSAISLGVAALVAVQGFALSLSRGVRTEARELLGADLQLSSRQPFQEGAEALLDSLRATGAEVARVTSFASMALAPRTGGTRLVQVRAPEPGYPFYGEILTEPAGAWSQLREGRSALVDPALLTALGVGVGDTLALGEGRFRIAGALQKVPGDVEIASAFAPRVFIPAGAVAETGLIDFGSRVDYEAFVRLPAAGAPERFIEENRPTLRRERVRTETVAEQQEELEDAMGRLSAYLGLVGALALLLGGIGVASAMGAYMAQKVDTVATLRCLGATAGQLLAVYLAQAAVMGLAGAVLGVTLGVAVQAVLPRLLAGLLPVEVEVGLEPIAMATGVGVGVWVATVFALLPLLRVRSVSPLGALRRRVEPLRPPRRDPARWAVWAALGGSLLLLLWMQVGELRTAAGVLAGVVAALALLWLAAAAAARALRRIPRGSLRYVIRQGLANLHRPGNQTTTVVLALGFGVYLLATLLLTQHNLLLPLRTGEAAERANLLLWDVQEDQEPGIGALLAAGGYPVVQQAPIVPMRVAAINGEEVRPWSAEELEAAEAEGEGREDAEDREDAEGPEGWALRREYRSTFRDSLITSERLLEGELWDPEVRGIEQVSLERDIAGDLAVALGDTITWDVQGVRIPTVVTSLREVDWARFEPNFFAVFPSRALQAAPKTWVMLTRADSAAERARLQRDLVVRFPNVAVLDLTRVQEALDEVIGRVSAVIRFLAGFSIATGFVVLLGAIATSRLQRMRESVLLKTLGATRRQIGWILFTEYLLLGVLAVVVGTALAGGAGWALARWVFEVPFEIAPLPLLVLGGVVVGLAVVVGLWTSREVFGRTPLEAIREE